MSETEKDESCEYDPSWITGKDLERHFELEVALLEFSRLFKHEEKNDRGLVIIGAAFLDTVLEHILISFLVDDPKEVAELLHYDQPLGTYGNRTRSAYCFGLINKTIRDDLRLVGKIRNRFAHDLYASFEDQQIAAWTTSSHHKAASNRSVQTNPGKPVRKAKKAAGVTGGSEIRQERRTKYTIGSGRGRNFPNQSATPFT